MPATSKKSNPAARAEAAKKDGKPYDRLPSAKVGFGKRETHTIQMPSGYEVKVIRPGINGLIKAGILESFDQLTSIVQSETIPKAEGKQKIDTIKAAQAIAADPAKVTAALDMIDKVVLHVCMEPRLSPSVTQEDVDAYNEANPDSPVTSPEQLEDPEKAYIHYVDVNDKTFIFQYVVGGSKDYERFREETEETLGSLRDGAATGETPE